MAQRGPLTNDDAFGASGTNTPGTDFPKGPSDALLVTSIGGGATATVTLMDGSSVALAGLTAGQIIRLRATQVQVGALATIVPLYW